MQKILYSNLLILKVLDDSYAGEVLDFVMRNKDFLNEWEVLRTDKYYTHAFQKQLLIEDINNIEAGQLYKVWLFKADALEKRIIGTVSISNIVKGAFQSCHLGYRIDEQERNKGYMTEAIERIITYAFQELKLHRIEANIMPKNSVSLKVVEKLNFYNEGTAAKYLKINGRWEDHIHMVLLNEEIE